MLNKNSIRDSLEYHRFDHDEFWSGLGKDDQGEHELFFSGGENGPSDTQIEIYLNFLIQLEEFRKVIRKKILDKIMAETPREFDTANQAIVKFNIANIPQDSIEYDIEGVFRLTYKAGLFKNRNIDFTARFKNGSIL